MHTNHNEAAPGQNGESVVRTDAPPAQRQPAVPDGAPAGASPFAAGTEGSNAQSQTTAATPDQLGNELHSVSAAEVLPPERDTVALAPLASDEAVELLSIRTLSHARQSDIDAMSFKELDSFVDAGVQILMLKQADIIRARKALVPAIWRVHDALSRQGKRTDLLDAPDGLTFDAWVKSKVNLGSRATIYRLLADAGMPPPRQFAEGAKVKVAGRGEAGVVTHAHEADDGVHKYDVLFEGEKEAVTVPAENLAKVRVRKIAVGDLVIVEDMCAEFRYAGGGKFVRTKKAGTEQKKTGSRAKRCA